MECNVLVIDDCEDTCIFVDRILRRLPVSVTMANSAGEGLKKAIACKPSLILLDYFLPDWNGMEVLGALKSEYWLRDIPVIMMTANTDRGLIEKAFASGASDYIAKPLYAEEVNARVKTLLCNHEKLLVAMRSSKVDPITCLPNREALMELLQSTIEDPRHRSTSGFSLMMFRLRGFSRVVDLYGQHIMDLALREIGAAMEKELHLLRIPNAGRCRSMVSRIQGAEFAMILPGSFTEERLHQIGDRILRTIERPLAIAGHTIRLNANIAAVTSHAYDNAENLMSEAFNALSKSRVSNSWVMNDGMSEGASCIERVYAELESLRAVSNCGFELRHELIQEVHGGRVFGIRFYAVDSQDNEEGLDGIDLQSMDNRRESITWMINRLLDSSFALPAMLKDLEVCTIQLPLAMESEVDDTLCDHIKRLANALAGRGCRLCLEFSAERYRSLVENNSFVFDELSRCGVRFGFTGVGTSMSSLEPLFDDRVHFLVIHPSTLRELERGFLSNDIVEMIRETARIRQQRLMTRGIDRVATANLARDLRIDYWSGALIEIENDSYQLLCPADQRGIRN